MIQASRDAIVHEVEYPHPIDAVWTAITDGEAISQWLMSVDRFVRRRVRAELARPSGRRRPR